jgi:hypothetical protein
VLRRIFGPKRDEVTGGWRKLHNEELHNLYSSPSIVRMIKYKKLLTPFSVTDNVVVLNLSSLTSFSQRDHLQMDIINIFVLTCLTKIYVHWFLVVSFSYWCTDLPVLLVLLQ